MKISQLFLWSAGVVLLVTSLAKFISCFGHGTILLVREPLFGFSFRNLFLIVGSVEALIALICFFSKCRWVPAGLIAWLATSFVSYRLSLWQMGWHKPCSCLGNLTDALHISPQLADNIMKVVLAYLLVGSYGLLIWQWKQRRQLAQIGPDCGPNDA